MGYFLIDFCRANMFLLGTKGANSFLDSPEVQVSIFYFSHIIIIIIIIIIICMLVLLILKNISGLALITKDDARLWTDGRYFLQATQQLSDQWKLMRIGEDPSVDAWMSDVNLPFCPPRFNLLLGILILLLNLFF